MSSIIVGPRTWRGARDTEGHRSWWIKHRVQCLSADGPAIAMQTPGLPIPGAWYIIDNDIDLWAWCHADTTVTPVLEGEPNTFFDVEQLFSTKPPDWRRQRCQDIQIQDPILEPARISGSFSRFSKEATHDRFGDPITNSAWEQVRGPQVEFDDSRPSVKIEQNVLDINLPLLAQFRDTVNDQPLWGLPARCIKVSNIQWERRFYGQCIEYFGRTLEFEVGCELSDGLGAIGTSAIVSSGGAGYNIGDQLMAVGGVYKSPTIFVVEQLIVGASVVSVLQPGEYTTVPTSPVNTKNLTGPGVGCTVAVAWGHPLVSTWDRELLDEGTKVLHGRWESIITGGLIAGGLRIDAVASGGAVVSATVNAGFPGSGGPKSGLFGVVLQGGNNNAIIQVWTDSTGKCIGAKAPYFGGTGYSTGTYLVQFNNNPQWVVNLDASGNPPSNLNPANFQAFQDQKNNVAKVTLDGTGLPIGNYDSNYANPGKLPVQGYLQNDFTQLGIPLVL